MGWVGCEVWVVGVYRVGRLFFGWWCSGSRCRFCLDSGSGVVGAGEGEGPWMGVRASVEGEIAEGGLRSWGWVLGRWVSGGWAGGCASWVTGSGAHWGRAG